MAAKSATATFTKERETKGTHVFAEDGEDNQVIGKLYIRKAHAEALGNPEKIKVVVSAA